MNSSSTLNNNISNSNETLNSNAILSAKLLSDSSKSSSSSSSSDYSSTASSSNASSPINATDSDDNEIYKQISHKSSRNSSLTADGQHMVLNGSTFFDNSSSKKIIHRVVLTGGPCAGKTTSINRVKSFFENIGWKVFCVPETATMLLSAGIYFYELEKHSNF